MFKIKQLQQTSERELDLGVSWTSASYHGQYSSCPYIYIKFLNTKTLPLSLSDVETIFSQFGEVLSSYSKGSEYPFCWIKFENPQSCILAVDNMTGFVLEDASSSTLLVDHAPSFSERTFQSGKRTSSHDYRPLKHHR
ncbi:hypothetical protein GEMRC1_003068 [Eukaryota sp. GEM-RC1]